MVSIPHLFFILFHICCGIILFQIRCKDPIIFFIIVFKLFNQNKRRSDVMSCFIPVVHSLFCDFLPFSILKMVEIFLIPFSLFPPENKIGNMKVLKFVDNSPTAESPIEQDNF